MLLTFHKILDGSKQGEREAWRAFLVDYSPITLTLIGIYLPECSEPRTLWRDALTSLCSEDFKALGKFSGNSEREFLLDLRAFLFEVGLAAVDARDSAELTAEKVSALVKGLPLLHQEVLFLKLAGYSDSTLELIFRVTPAVAQKSLERLRPDYSAALGKEQNTCVWPAAWLKLGRNLRAQRTEACPSLRQFIRIQDGQAGWYDKEPAEKHVSECLTCLEGWTALREVSYWRRAVEPVSAGAVEDLLRGLPVRQQPEEAKSFFKKG
ncbi:MAG: hypothetical protein ACRD2B_14765 [Terriglobia bacterium]